jgi:hypothetical protein
MRAPARKRSREKWLELRIFFFQRPEMARPALGRGDDECRLPGAMRCDLIRGAERFGLFWPPGLLSLRGAPPSFGGTVVLEAVASPEP